MPNQIYTLYVQLITLLQRQLEILHLLRLQQDCAHRRAIEQHEWARSIAGGGDGSTARHVVHRRQHSRDSSGRERFCEHRAIDGRYRTLRWDTNDIDERGEVRRHTTSGVEADAGRTSMNMTAS